MPGEGVVAQEGAGGGQGGGDDDGAVLGELGDAGRGVDPHAEAARVLAHAGDDRAPAAVRVAGGGVAGPGDAQQPLLGERGGQGAHVGGVGGDAEHAYGRLAGHGTELGGRPRAEVHVDGGGAAASQGEHPGERGGREHAEPSGVPEAEPGQVLRPDPRGRLHEPARGQPPPRRAVGVEGVGAVVGDVGRGRGPGTAAEGGVRLVQDDFGAALGAADRRGQPREAAADDGDGRHAVKDAGPTRPVTSGPAVSRD